VDVESLEENEKEKRKKYISLCRKIRVYQKCFKGSVLKREGLGNNKK